MVTIEEVQASLQKGNITEGADLIKKGLDEGANFSSRAISFAHLLVLSGPWHYVSALVSQSRNTLFMSGWLNSIAKGRPVNAYDQPIPWLTFPAIDFLDGIIKPDWKVFEWGSGNSTLWWSSRVKSVHAVEDNLSWQQEVSKKMPENAKVEFAGTCEDYVAAYLNSEEESYDVVVVDGEHRNECAKVALDKLKPGGIIIFDNDDGVAMNEGVDFLNSKGLYRLDFWGLIPSYLYKNCTSIFLSDPAILRRTTRPSEHKSSIGPSCQQAVDGKL